MKNKAVNPTEKNLEEKWTAVRTAERSRHQDSKMVISPTSGEEKSHGCTWEAAKLDTDVGLSLKVLLKDLREVTTSAVLYYRKYSNVKTGSVMCFIRR